MTSRGKPFESGDQPSGRPFPKGRSANPGGLPKEVRALRKLIGEKTDNGVGIVDFAVGVMNGTVEGMKDARARAYAHQWLSDRYFGKAKQAIEISHSEPEQAGPPPALHELLDVLDERDRVDLERILLNLERAKQDGRLALPAPVAEDDGDDPVR